MTDPTYDDSRARRLVELLRALAARIGDLDGDEDLLEAGPELLNMMGDARSELFHYEVRSTYDSPEVAESRRIVEQARAKMQDLEFGDKPLDPDDKEDDQSWHSR